MTVTCGFPFRVVDMAARPCGPNEQDLGGGASPISRYPHVGLIQAAASSSGRCAGSAIPVADASGNGVVERFAADNACVSPFLATCDGTVMATSVPVPVPQPSAETKYALKHQRTSANLLQVSCLSPPCASRPGGAPRRRLPVPFQFPPHTAARRRLHSDCCTAGYMYW